ncbi:beta-ketoacyl-[acyl-carrier-protein] synthase family protein [Leucobacter zeae]|nr:beta-ketoacyl-[acyl-carrier-protein] synthase family protein [Leucobacter zeae]
MNGRRRVVISGLGAVTPSGLGAPALWESVRGGRSAIERLDRGDDGDRFADGPIRIGGRVTGFDAGAVLEPALARRLSPVQHWAVAAADEALAQAGAPVGRQLPWDDTRVSVIAASGSGPVDAVQHATLALEARGSRGVPLTLSVYGSHDSAAAVLSQRHGFRGQSQGVSAACASSAVALGEGVRRIRHGYADAVLVVGMEDCLNPVHLASNANLRALAIGYEASPAEASRPFDRSRSGFVMSQGAAAILLESAESARARGATALAELAGFGSASDAHHATAPHPEGRGGAAAVRDCLADAGVGPDAVDHINAHGTGTPAGDAAELAALASALGEPAREIPISATKSSTGHLLGAAGAVEAVVSVMSLRDGLLPPTINLVDPEFPEWDIVSGRARVARISTVLSTSFGFGGHNGALLLRSVA